MKTVECVIDLRAGGLFSTTMQSPEGQNFPNIGCFLEIIENKKLVWTDALLPGYRPVTQPASEAGMLKIEKNMKKWDFIKDGILSWIS
jgi:uncharacterized protein YndB with AHSA1/START domain